MFPEHTDVSYKAAARMGAGIVECDVTFTADGKLVCRHDECDLSTTTNITSTPLNGACTIPWSPGIQSPKCCTSDISSNQFKILSPKMDASVPGALTPQIYQGGTADWRTDLYVGRANVMTLKESIALNESLGVKHTPELKAGDPARIKRVFGSQANYAKAMVETFIQAGISPKNVFMQSFNLDDVLYWVKYYPAFGRQAVYLDDVDPTTVPATPRLTVQELRDIRNKGVRTLAPPMWALLAVQNGQIVPSQYAKDIQAADLDIIAWTFERADLRKGVPRTTGITSSIPTARSSRRTAICTRRWTCSPSK
ncbi:MAG: glycerophosphodiester phosphodiesterase family protein [Acidobacteriota bacterium]